MEEQKPEKIYVLCDLETTGLDSRRDQILEIAAVHFTNLSLLELGETFIESCFFKNSPPDLAISEIVWQMHFDNGLWDECEHARPAEEVLSDFGLWLRRLGGEDHNVVLVGNSVHFDRGFLLDQAPAIVKRQLSHRVLDVTTLRVFFEEMTGQELYSEDSAHRAVEDCMRSHRLMQAARKILRP